jgi:hypothetical protein
VADFVGKTVRSAGTYSFMDPKEMRRKKEEDYK